MALSFIKPITMLFKNQKKIISSWSYIIEFVFLTIYLFYVIQANIDLTSAYSLCMDELFTFNQIKKIYSSSTFIQFLHNIFDGNDHRWGRIHFNFSAITSYIPYIIFGETGQIIATRMTSSLLLISSYIILSHTFIKSPPWRSASIIVLSLLPTTPYHVRLPKPDQLQMFLISIFFVFFIKHGFKSLRIWFVLGLALGAKISLLPFAIFFTGLKIILICYKKNNLIDKFKETGKNLLLIYLGLAVAIPILFSFRFSEYFTALEYRTHLHDDQAVNFLSWINLLIKYYFYTPSYIVCLFFIIISIGTLFLYKDFCNKNIKLKQQHILLLILGFSYILPTMLFIKRLWVFYIHSGLVYIIIAGISGVSVFFMNKKNNHPVSLGKSILFLLFLTYCFFEFQIGYKRYMYLSTRTKNPNFILKKKEHTFLTNFLEQKSKSSTTLISVLHNPNFFIIKSTDSINAKRFWGPFLEWNEGANYIIDYKSEEADELIKKLTPERNYLYDKTKEAVRLKELHTNSSCNQKICYKNVPIPLDHVVIYEKLTR